MKTTPLFLPVAFSTLLFANVSLAATHNTPADTFKKECEANLAETERLFTKIEASTKTRTIDNTLLPLNELEVLLDRGYNKVQLYYNVHPQPSIREVAEKCQQDFAELATRISLSRPLYDAIRSISVKNAAADTQRHVEHMLRDFRRSGVNKDAATRARIKQLREELVVLGQRFGRNIREDVRSVSLPPASLQGLPQDYIDSHASGADGKVVITTDYPDYIPFMTYAEDDQARRQLYSVFRNRGYPDNEEVLEEILAKRYTLANILGYKNYAEYVTEDKMIKNAENVASFITKIAALAEARAQKDYQVLLERLQKIDPQASTVGDWQKAYITELVKQESYQYDSKAVRQYFDYAKVRDGIFQLVSRLFDVRIEPWKTEVWDENVEAYALSDEDGLIGYFYLDMHPREGKYKHAAHFPLQSGLADKQPPISTLVCNFPGGDAQSALMNHSQVETFLHEFGHLLHHIFSGRQQWYSFSGVSTEWDFVEAPSQMLEEWIWDSETLKLFAKNAQGETIPDALIEKMNQARYFGRGLWVKNQLFYAATSLNYYNRAPESFELLPMMIAMQEKYSPYDYVEGTHFYASFGHLYGYSAIYYTYMWSLVIANDMFSKFQKYGLMNPEVAGEYMAKVLAPGGSKDAARLVEDFLGRPYSFAAFEKELNQN